MERKLNIKGFEDYNYEEQTFGIDDVSVTYIQTQDTTTREDDDAVQSLKIETVNYGAGRFFRFTTDSNGWSIDDIDELVALFKDFSNRAMINKEAREDKKDE